MTKYQEWARAKYTPGEPIDEMLHPEIVAEMKVINAEAEEKKRQDKAKIKQVIESVDDLQQQFDKCIAIRFGFRGSIREQRAATKLEMSNLLAKLDEESRAKVLAELKNTKRLLAKKGFAEWEILKSERSKWSDQIKGFGIPHVIDGMTVVRIEKIPEVEQLLDEIEQAHAKLVESMFGAYPKATSKEVVDSPLYDPRDYPATEAIKPKFRVVRQWAHFGVPEILKEIDPVRWEAERQRTAAMWQEIKEKGVLGLRKLVADMAARLVETLKPDEKTGEKKRFYATALTNLTEFFETFENRNIAGDVELREEVEKLKKLIEGKDLEKFKTDEAVRETVLEQGAQIAARLQEMVVLSADRVVTFED